MSPDFEVKQIGCVCAEKMTNDYLNPIKLEQKLLHRAARRTNWKNKEKQLVYKTNSVRR